MIEAYCDGSVSAKRAGWGFVGLRDGEVIHQHQSPSLTAGTNQQMELIAAKEACEWAVQNRKVSAFELEPIIIYSDSAYVINCYNQKWWRMWEDNGWRNAKNEEVANKTLWLDLIKYFKMPFFDFRHIKGHSGHIYNELADKLAKGTAQPVSDADLTNNKKKDKIFIELSELMLEYKTNKISTNEAINGIYNIMESNK